MNANWHRYYATDEEVLGAKLRYCQHHQEFELHKPGLTVSHTRNFFDKTKNGQWYKQSKPELCFTD